MEMETDRFWIEGTFSPKMLYAIHLQEDLSKILKVWIKKHYLANQGVNHGNGSRHLLG